jgi:elongation of very long chain fatty acids protein 4
VTPNIGRTAPFKLVQILHNLFLIVASFWTAYNLYVTMRAADYKPLLNDVHRDAHGILITKVLYVAWLLRIYEFVDTFLIMLKKNYRQASFLHIYHHASVLSYIFFGVWNAPNGETTFPCFLNACVHVVMYTYYLASTLNIRMPFKYSITIMQLIQFVWIATIFGARLVTGKPGYPALTCYVSVAYMATMLLLFGNFFIKNALSKKPSPAGGKTQPKAVTNKAGAKKGGKRE